MSITTPEEASKLITGWLEENSHQVKTIEHEESNFHFEVDYPLGSMKRQRILQPKDYPGLCLILYGIGISDDHKTKLGQMPEDELEAFYDELRLDLLFLDNNCDIIPDEKGIVQTIQFSCEFYFDSLTKTQIFKSLVLNHKSFMYIVNKFNTKFGIPMMPEGAEGETIQ
ncbi:MAG: DUF2299 family protein [Thermodesulfobacteriota bacterium]